MKIHNNRYKGVKGAIIGADIVDYGDDGIAEVSVETAENVRGLKGFTVLEDNQEPETFGMQAEAEAAMAAEPEAGKDPEPESEGEVKEELAPEPESEKPVRTPAKDKPKKKPGRPKKAK